MLNKKTNILIGCVAIVAGILIAMMTGGHTYNAEDYVQIIVEGDSGEATAYAEIDDDRLEENLLKNAKKPVLKKIKAEFGSDYKDALDLLNEFSIRDLKDLGMTEEQIDALKLYKKMRSMDVLDVELSKEENIKNGDKIKVTYIYDNKENKEMGFSFKGKEKVVTVEGLSRK